MKALSEYRAEARKSLKGKWLGSAMFVLVYFVIGLIINGLTSIPVPGREGITMGASLIGILIILPLAYGIGKGFLCQYRGGELEIGQLFSGYNRRVWVAMILKMLIIILWAIPAFILSIALVIGGVMMGMDEKVLMPAVVVMAFIAMIPMYMKAYAYSMMEYLLVLNPEMNGREALKESERLTQGSKMRIFLLDLSFIGWILLSVLTLFIGTLWVQAYQYTARIAFFEDLNPIENLKRIEE